MIYLDNAATTKPDINAINYAKGFLLEKYYNPSALYRNGIEVANSIKETKQNVLKYLSGVNFDVVFTSCGTESDNQAIFCAVKRGVFVTDKGEHSAVYKSFLELKNRGNTVLFADLNKDGSVNIDSLIDIIRNNKVDFVSIMHVNNETGAINDINAIARAIKSINKNIVFHSDGVQAYGKLSYKLSNDIDLYSISGHKINALKGTGALLINKRIKIAPFLIGGGQENGLRSGTENVFGIKVFDFASKNHYNNITENFNYVKKLKEKLISKLDKDLFYIISSKDSSPYILSVSAIGLKGEIVMHLLEEKGIIVGNGSACSSKSPFSRVIESCGLGKDILSGVIRISFSIDIKKEDIDLVADELNSTVKDLKRIIK